MLQTGDQFPHVEMATAEGRPFSYSSIWQRRNLVLVVLQASDGDREYVSELARHAREFLDRNTECVVTREPVGGLKAPAFLVADKWGEVIHVVSSPELEQLPSRQDLLEWVEYVEHKCPECEGEAK